MPGEQNLSNLDAIYRRTGEEAKARRAELDEELSAVNARRADLLDALRKLNKLISFIDGPPPRKRGPQQPTHKGTGKPSDAKLDEVETWLRAHVNGEDFTTPELVRRDDWLGQGDAYTSHILNFLHERGTLRLVRTGHPDFGPKAKVWKLTNA